MASQDVAVLPVGGSSTITTTVQSKPSKRSRSESVRRNRREVVVLRQKASDDSVLYTAMLRHVQKNAEAFERQIRSILSLFYHKDARIECPRCHYENTGMEWAKANDMDKLLEQYGFGHKTAVKWVKASGDDDDSDYA